MPQERKRPVPTRKPDARAKEVDHHYREGMTLLDRGQAEEASQRFFQSVRLNPDHAAAHHNLAVALARTHRHEESLAHFLRCVELNPESADAYGNLFLVYSQLGRGAEALDSLRQKARLLPGSAQVRHQLGDALRAAGHLDEAIACLHEAIRLKPDGADLHSSLGMALSRQGKTDESMAAYRKAIELNPKLPSAHNNLGILWLEQRQHAKAMDCFQESLRLQPNSAETHNNVGIVLAEQEKQEEAVVHYREALRLKANYAEAHNNLGNAARDLGHVEEAVFHLEEALRLKPEYAEAYNNLGIAFVLQNRLEEAVSHYDRALALRSDYPEARKNRALVRLGMGDFERGWIEYEHRWHDKNVPARKMDRPAWDGSPLAGRTLLVYPEQGLGDTIQFVRYLPLVQQHGGRVVFECPTALVPLLTPCRGFDVLVPEKTTLPEFDVHAPTLSLPWLLQMQAEPIPADVPYVVPDAARVSHWCQVLQRLPGFKVGVAWQGNPRFKADRHRSMPLRHFAALAGIPGVRLISLQKGKGLEQLPKAGFPVLHLGNDVDKAGAFTDTAAIMKNLDLVITSDTAIAHLAGALGVPVWVALPFAPDWRWLREREDSPWYPTMRLFRQKERGDWPGVFARLADALAGLIPATASATTGAALARAVPDTPSQPAAPDVTERLGRLGVSLWKQGNLLEAAGCLREVLRQQPMAVEAETNLGLVCLDLGQPEVALGHFRRCAALRPERADVACNLGVAYLRLNQLDNGIAAYREAIRLKPDFVNAHNNLGNALRLAGRLDQAVLSLREALRQRPTFAEAHFNLGLTLAQQDKADAAMDAFRDVLRHRPAHAGAHYHLGAVLAQRQRHDEAMVSLRQAAQLEPGRAEVHYQLGNSLRLSGQVDAAIACYREAARLRPDYVEAHNNLGILLAGLDRFDEAEAAYRQGLQAKPHHVDVLNNLGVLMTNVRRLDEAQACYAEVLQVAPEHADTHRNRALAWLLEGDLTRGWEEYEWRLRGADTPGSRLKPPRWDGSPLAGRTLLLQVEQGLGDTLHFVRYAGLAKAQGGTIHLECPPGLIPLLRSCSGIDRLIPQGAPLPPFDVHASLLSLPFLLKTTRDTIPASIPYLGADGKLVERWRKQLEQLAGFKVGMAWQGNPRYGGDRSRSIPLRCFAPLSRVRGTQLVSLQKGPGTDQLTQPEADFPLLTFDRQVDERSGAFMDTAALIRNLDLVITSDCAVAHLAGALGAPVWLLLPLVPDWRWMLNGEETPWYPTMRLFRQRRRGDWDEVFARVAAAMAVTATAALHRRPILAAIAPGELIDKITILAIKKARISDPDKLRNVCRELEMLEQTRSCSCPAAEPLDRLTEELHAINEALWDVEDELRGRETAGDFGPDFVALARSVYQQNDRRAAVKRRINECLGSSILEEKSYSCTPVQ